MFSNERRRITTVFVLSARAVLKLQVATLNCSIDLNENSLKSACQQCDDADHWHCYSFIAQVLGAAAEVTLGDC